MCVCARACVCIRVYVYVCTPECLKHRDYLRATMLLVRDHLFDIRDVFIVLSTRHKTLFIDFLCSLAHRYDTVHTRSLLPILITISTTDHY